MAAKSKSPDVILVNRTKAGLGFAVHKDEKKPVAVKRIRLVEGVYREVEEIETENKREITKVISVAATLDAAEASKTRITAEELAWLKAHDAYFVACITPRDEELPGQDELPREARKRGLGSLSVREAR